MGFNANFNGPIADSLDKQIDKLRQALHIAEEALETFHTSGHHVVRMANCVPCEAFAKIEELGIKE